VNTELFVSLANRCKLYSSENYAELPALYFKDMETDEFSVVLA
tara:strand:+ start:1761 stop:1889 length:129 start_codon:yes stop_codon:yes gene_type:complete